MRVTVRRPGQSTQPVTRVRKRAEDGLVKRSVKRPSRRSHTMTGGSPGPADGRTGDAEDIVSKSAPPWIGRRATVPTGAPPPPLLHPQPAPQRVLSNSSPTPPKCESPLLVPAPDATQGVAIAVAHRVSSPRKRPDGLPAPIPVDDTKDQVERY